MVGCLHFDQDHSIGSLPHGFSFLYEPGHETTNLIMGELYSLSFLLLIFIVSMSSYYLLITESELPVLALLDVD